MNRQAFGKPPRWWSPMLSPRSVRAWAPLRRWQQRRVERLLDVEVRGTHHVRQSIDAGYGVLIIPNHPSHADCFALYAASDAIGCPFYVMVAWQVLGRGSWIRRLVLRQHGCFSVDREGTDKNAVRMAREILESARFPLVIFPEGEVYHVNDRITPFRDGPAAIALMAAKKSQRPIVSVPCGMKYRYVRDPSPELSEVMDQLEEALYWRPRRDLSLKDRIYHLAEGMIALKEVEFLGHTSAGCLPDRIRRLARFVLCRIEQQYSLDAGHASIPERVKRARQYAIRQLEQLAEGDASRTQYNHDLEDLFLVVQAFSYPGDYVDEQPSIERMAETVDKLEEDVLGAATASIRGTRTAVVSFGEPLRISAERTPENTASRITKTLEQRVQQLIHEV